MNIADGYGLVWNPGQPEEGYTSLMHVLIMVIPCLIMEDPLIIAQVVNAVCVLSTALLIFAFGRRYSDSILLPAAVTLLFIIAPITWSNAYSGMETSIFGLLVVATFYTYVHTDRIKLAFFLAFLTGLARPEGLAIGVLMAGYELIRRRQLPIASIWYFLPLIAYVIGKTAYYGYLLPNPFVFKAAIPGEPFKLHGVAYVRMFGLSMLPLTLLALASAKISIRDRRLVVLAFALVVLLFYTIPSPLMGFHDRFLYSVAVCLMLLGAATNLQQALWMRAGMVVLLLVQGVMLFACPRMQQTLTDDHSEPHHAFDVIGNVLGELPERRSIHVAVTEAGYLPFRSKMHVTDLHGLNTRAFATEKNPRRNIDRMFELAPDVLVLTASNDSGEAFTAMKFQHGVSMKEHHLIPQHQGFDRFEPLMAMKVTGDIYTTISLDRSSEHYPRLREHLLRRLSGVEGVKRVQRLDAGN